MPVVKRYAEDGSERWVRLRYAPLHYRVPPGTVARLRAAYDAYPVSNLWDGDPDGLMRSYAERGRFVRDGKSWVTVRPWSADWRLEIEDTDGLGEIREVPPEIAWEQAREDDRMDPNGHVILEGEGRDPRYREIIHEDGRREYFRARFDPQNFVASDGVIERIRRESRNRGSNVHFESATSGPFRDLGVVQHFERDGKRWTRLSGTDLASEFLLDIERSDHADFAILRVPPREAWEWFVAKDRAAFPELKLEGEAQP